MTNPQLSYLIGVVSLLGLLISGARLWQKHLDDTAAICQRVEQLEQIAVSEHPDYSKTIYYAGAKTCP
jgi:hypothetical protein